MMTFIDLWKTFPALKGHLIHTARIPADELVSTLERIGFRVFVINGSVISDKASFFEETARALHFPGYFGKNWDAFNDCVRDFCQSIDQSNTAIVWNRVENLLSADLQTFTDAICILYEQVSGMSLRWVKQGEDQPNAAQIEVFLVGNDPRFPILSIEK